LTVMSRQICENQRVTQTINPDNTWQHLVQLRYLYCSDKQRLLSSQFVRCHQNLKAVLKHYDDFVW